MIFCNIKSGEMGKWERLHISKATFKQIFKDHCKAFKNRHPRYDDEYYDEVINKIVDAMRKTSVRQTQ